MSRGDDSGVGIERLAFDQVQGPTSTDFEPGDFLTPSNGLPAYPSRPGMGIWTAATVAAWVYMVMLITTAASRMVRLPVPDAATALLQALTPILYLPVYVVGGVAIVRRQWVTSVVALGLVLVHLFSIAPAMGSTDVPSWASSSRALRVVSANVHDDNQEPDRAAAALMAQQADVIVVIEITPRFAHAMVRAGVDVTYPYHLFGTHGAIPGTENVYSRFPLMSARQLPIANVTFDAADVRFGGTSISLVAVHIDSARISGNAWRSELHGLARVMEATEGPAVVVGDFNAGRWNPEFGELLRSGWSDAHESRGKGLSFSWPAAGADVPFIRIDHALVSDQLAVREVRDFSVPGSDHRGFLVELAVRVP